MLIEDDSDDAPLVGAASSAASSDGSASEELLDLLSQYTTLVAAWLVNANQNTQRAKFAQLCDEYVLVSTLACTKEAESYAEVKWLVDEFSKLHAMQKAH